MARQAGRIQVFYDGRCGWCRAGAARLKRLDWFDSLEAIDYTTLAPEQRPVSEEVFQSGMPLRTRDGRVLIGFDAVRHALLRTPVGWFVGWFLYLPGLSHLGRRRYNAFARRRPRDGESAACRVDG